mmetsp:Transcript_28076/g.68262  ORF Transcript_28076/g.68262 Transcript_28076/m.68262 type:complete len:227 (+) Transcript_28076:243-923(+)
MLAVVRASLDPRKGGGHEGPGWALDPNADSDARRGGPSRAGGLHLRLDARGAGAEPKHARLSAATRLPEYESVDRLPFRPVVQNESFEDAWLGGAQETKVHRLRRRQTAGFFPADPPRPGDLQFEFFGRATEPAQKGPAEQAESNAFGRERGYLEERNPLELRDRKRPSEQERRIEGRRREKLVRMLHPRILPANRKAAKVRREGQRFRPKARREARSRRQHGGNT